MENVSTGSWTPEGIHKVTKTRFTPAGWDIDGFNAQGIDKLDNKRDGRLYGKMTRLLTKLIMDHEDGDTFTKAEANPAFWSAKGMSAGARRSFFTYAEAVDDLITEGFLIKAGRRWTINTAEAMVELPEVYAKKAEKAA